MLVYDTRGLGKHNISPAAEAQEAVFCLRPV